MWGKCWTAVHTLLCSCVLCSPRWWATRNSPLRIFLPFTLSFLSWKSLSYSNSSPLCRKELVKQLSSQKGQPSFCSNQYGIDLGLRWMMLIMWSSHWKFSIVVVLHQFCCCLQSLTKGNMPSECNHLVKLSVDCFCCLSFGFQLASCFGECSELSELGIQNSVSPAGRNQVSRLPSSVARISTRKDCNCCELILVSGSATKKWVILPRANTTPMGT